VSAVPCCDHPSKTSYRIVDLVGQLPHQLSNLTPEPFPSENLSPEGLYVLLSVPRLFRERGYVSTRCY